MSDLLALLGLGAVYGAGVRRAWASAGRGRIVHRWQVVSFAAGLVVTAVALCSPLDAAADTDLVAHMTQHVLLLVVSAPLLALGAPVPALLWVLPGRWRARGNVVWRRALRSQSGSGWYGWVVVALVLQTAAMWAWHIPSAYDAALDHLLVHAAEHASYLLTAGLFWWVVAGGRRDRLGQSVLVLFAAGFPGMALGAAMLLAPRPWYPAYASTTALVDQQVAAVVMWAVGGLVYIVAAAALTLVWLRQSERTSPSRATGPVAVGGTP